MGAGWGSHHERLSQKQEEGVKKWVDSGCKEGPRPRERCPWGRIQQTVGRNWGLRQDPGAGGCGDSVRQEAVSVSPGGTPVRLLASRAAHVAPRRRVSSRFSNPPWHLLSHVLPG